DKGFASNIKNYINLYDKVVVICGQSHIQGILENLSSKDVNSKIKESRIKAFTTLYNDSKSKLDDFTKNQSELKNLTVSLIDPQIMKYTKNLLDMFVMFNSSEISLKENVEIVIGKNKEEKSENNQDNREDKMERFI